MQFSHTPQGHAEAEHFDTEAAGCFVVVTARLVLRCPHPFAMPRM